jgi:hypothetical protein
MSDDPRFSFPFEFRNITIAPSSNPEERRALHRFRLQVEGRLPFPGPDPALRRLIFVTRYFLETVRNHKALSTVPGYDHALGLHLISEWSNRVKQALETRLEDPRAAGYRGVLEVCVERVVAGLSSETPWDAAAIEGVEKALAALESLRARRQGEPANPAAPPRGPEPAAIAAGPPPSPSSPVELTTALPQSLDSRAVGIAHELLEKDGSINVSEVARRLVVERTKLYRCKGFMALVNADRQSNHDRKAGFRRGSKNRETGRIECADDD